MELTAAVRLCIERLEAVLSREFGGQGKNLAERLENADIPQEIKGHLRKIVRNAAADDASRDPAVAMEVVFLCGQVHERLEALAAARLVEPFHYVEVDGTPGPEIETADIANVAQFVQAWNQFMRKVTDFVLKLLLVGVIVLFIGLLAGVI
jgi:hypothetical protein